MQKISSIQQSPIYVRNYQSNIIDNTPSFKQNATMAQVAFDTASKNRKNILKIFTAFLSSLGIFKAAKEISKNQAEEEKNAKLMPEEEQVTANTKKSTKAEKLKQAEAKKRAEKLARRNSAMVKELEQVGYTNIRELKNDSLSFEYQGVTYQITKDPKMNDNLYKALMKAIQYGSLPKGINVYAIGNETPYDCDWLFGPDKQISENLYKFIACDTDTPFAQHYLKDLKNDNPAKYIEIMTPKKLFRTTEGKEFLKKYAPDKYNKQVENLIEEGPTYQFNPLEHIEYRQLLEEALRFYNNDEIFELIKKYPCFICRTDAGERCIEELKTKNPTKYIDYRSPRILYSTLEGREYLKENAPDIYEEQEAKEKAELELRKNKKKYHGGGDNLCSTAYVHTTGWSPFFK